QRALEYVSYALKVPRVDLFAIREFFDLLHEAPPSRGLGLCANAACAARGGGEVATLLRRAVEARPDLDLQVKDLPCQGCCDLAPVAVFDRSPRRLTLPRARRLARALGEGRLDPGPAPAPGGRVRPTPTRVVYRSLHRPAAHRLAVARAHGGYAALEQVVRAGSPEAVIGALAESGLLGAGGAGFPAGRKWEAVRRAPGAEKVVVVNADEGEPGTFKDRPILERDPHLLIEGAAIAGYAVGASQGFLYLRGEYRLARERLAQALVEAREAGFLGDRVAGTPFAFHLHLRLGAGAYVAGEETALLESLEGRPALPRVKPPYPSERGLFGRPTLVNNVETLATVPAILEHGPAWYRGLGRNGSGGVKVFCLSGEVARPGNYELPRGITARDLIFDYGDGLRGKQPLKAFLAGGASGGFLPPEALDVPLETAPLRARGADLGSGAVMVVGPQSCLLDLARRETRFFAEESCGACDPCRLGTRALLVALESLSDPAIRTEAEARVRELGAVLADASRCGLGQVAANPLLSVLTHFPGEIAAHARGACPAGVCGRRPRRPR
ncbi:MAG TPA: NADH-ubiquinone oxidoreductase-F iron-sulfur binding region domain-containing protein, partial [Candidatus Methylomirabilis sp.]|nr:NADH-ubiquinone oxidoreductase-F iron-sulfur binding region domain-containing protein [Candidatus Methylomirabilis sp.]